MDSEVLLKLADDGLKGDVKAFEMRLRQVVSKLKNDNPKLAEELGKKLIGSSLRGVGSQKYSAIPVDNDSRLNLLKEEYPVELDSDPIWSEQTHRFLQKVILERNSLDILTSESLQPIRTLLFEGPPGVGKTLTARWLARELDVPLLTLDLASVMSSYLGKTGNNIRSVLDYGSKFPCVLLLDEFDSIAKKRNDDAEVGELKRLVTVLLQTVDEWTENSLLVAATNHPELLDPAVWRRFDLTINFQMPSLELIEEYLKKMMIEEEYPSYLLEYLDGLSFSDIRRILLSVKKSQVLEGVTFFDGLMEMLAKEVGKEKVANAKVQVLYLHNKGLSQRSIEKEVGMSRPTIKKVLDEALDKGWIDVK